MAVERHLMEHLVGPQRPNSPSDIGRLELRGEGTTDHMLLLWSSSQCVVIGRHQNPWMECDLGRMASEGVPLVRRISGGGAVYHDAGNTNFTFIGADSTYSLVRQFNVVIAALDLLGISARRNERNDLLVGERKISGNAFRHTKGRSLHHGTLLVSADLHKLTAYLSVPGAAAADAEPAIISTKGIPSVRAQVVNLSDINPDLTRGALIEALRAAYYAEYGIDRTGGFEGLNSDDDHGSDQIALYESEMRSWEWRFGMTPAFSCLLTVPVPGRRTAADLIVTMRHGHVESVTLADRVRQAGRELAKSESLPPSGLSRDIVVAVRAADELLRGVRYVREDILAVGHGARAECEIIALIAEAAGPEMPAF